jgi:hypothetical protein
MYRTANEDEARKLVTRLRARHLEGSDQCPMIHRLADFNAISAGATTPRELLNSWARVAGVNFANHVRKSMSREGSNTSLPTLEDEQSQHVHHPIAVADAMLALSTRSN